MKSTDPGSTRRGFLAVLAGLSLPGLLLFLLGRSRRSPVTVNVLRPPGAVPEERFPGECIRCGRCAEVCPYRSIELADTGDGVESGTPLIRALEVPCYLCMECVEVCPSGALRPIELEDTRMGLAEVDREHCVAWTGDLLCRTCYNVCPLQDQAIDLPLMRPEVNDEHCTGCGLCAHGCPITVGEDRKAINVDPGKGRAPA